MTAKNKFIQTFGRKSSKVRREFELAADEITSSDVNMYGTGVTSIASLMHSGDSMARTRQEIYDYWSYMESNPIISTALKLLVTAALGGHESNGNIVFIETRPNYKDKRGLYIIDELRNEILPLLNEIAFSSSYTALVFGDSYARVYSNKNGVTDLYIDEMVRPSLVQPFERGSRTVGYAVSSSKRDFYRLNALQMARMKMPRTQWIPQTGVLEKSLRFDLEIDEASDLPIFPAMVGGSYLYTAEKPFFNLNAALVGLVGQRLMDSIDEQMVGVNLSSMNKDQQKIFLKSITDMLERSRRIAESAIKTNRPVLERIRHLVPTFSEKQVTQITGGMTGSGRAAQFNIEDVMLHARMLASTFGTDLSMIGFADQMSGGLGEGGFFRTSAQIGENSRIIRSSITKYFNSIVDIHTIKKYGFLYEPNYRPFNFNFYSCISSAESELQRNRTEAANSSLMLIQAIQQFKDMGADYEMMYQLLTKNMLIDEDLARLYSEIVNITPNDANGEG